MVNENAPLIFEVPSGAAPGEVPTEQASLVGCMLREDSARVLQSQVPQAQACKTCAAVTGVCSLLVVAALAGLKFTSPSSSPQHKSLPASGVFLGMTEKIVADPLPHHPCPEQFHDNTAFEPLDMNESDAIRYAANVSECQQMCLQTPSCTYITYYALSTMTGLCHFAMPTAVLSPNRSGFIAGPSLCKGQGGQDGRHSTQKSVIETKACITNHSFWPLDSDGSPPTYAGSPLDCQNRCAGFAWCKGWVFNTLTRFCELADGAAEVVQPVVYQVAGLKSCHMDITFDILLVGPEKKNLMLYEWATRRNFAMQVLQRAIIKLVGNPLNESEDILSPHQVACWACPAPGFVGTNATCLVKAHAAHLMYVRDMLKAKDAQEKLWQLANEKVDDCGEHAVGIRGQDFDFGPLQNFGWYLNRSGPEHWRCLKSEPAVHKPCPGHRIITTTATATVSTTVTTTSTMTETLTTATSATSTTATATSTTATATASTATATVTVTGNATATETSTVTATLTTTYTATETVTVTGTATATETSTATTTVSVTLPAWLRGDCNSFAMTQIESVIVNDLSDDETDPSQEVWLHAAGDSSQVFVIGGLSADPSCHSFQESSQRDRHWEPTQAAGSYFWPPHVGAIKLNGSWNLAHVLEKVPSEGCSASKLVASLASHTDKTDWRTNTLVKWHAKQDMQTCGQHVMDDGCLNTRCYEMESEKIKDVRARYNVQPSTDAPLNEQVPEATAGRQASPIPHAWIYLTLNNSKVVRLELEPARYLPMQPHNWNFAFCHVIDAVPSRAEEGLPEEDAPHSVPEGTTLRAAKEQLLRWISVHSKYSIMGTPYMISSNHSGQGSPRTNTTKPKKTCGKVKMSYRLAGSLKTIQFVSCQAKKLSGEGANMHTAQNLQSTDASNSRASCIDFAQDMFEHLTNTTIPEAVKAKRWQAAEGYKHKLFDALCNNSTVTDFAEHNDFCNCWKGTKGEGSCEITTTTSTTMGCDTFGDNTIEAAYLDDTCQVWIKSRKASLIIENELICSDSLQDNSTQGDAVRYVCDSPPVMKSSCTVASDEVRHLSSVDWVNYDGDLSIQKVLDWTNSNDLLLVSNLLKLLSTNHDRIRECGYVEDSTSYISVDGSNCTKHDHAHGGIQPASSEPYYLWMGTNLAKYTGTQSILQKCIEVDAPINCSQTLSCDNPDINRNDHFTVTHQGSRVCAQKLNPLGSRWAHTLTIRCAKKTSFDENALYAKPDGKAGSLHFHNMQAMPVVIGPGTCTQEELRSGCVVEESGGVRKKCVRAPYNKLDEIGDPENRRYADFLNCSAHDADSDGGRIFDYDSNIQQQKETQFEVEQRSSQICVTSKTDWLFQLAFNCRLAGDYTAIGVGSSRNAHSKKIQIDSDAHCDHRSANWQHVEGTQYALDPTSSDDAVLGIHYGADDDKFSVTQTIGADGTSYVELTRTGAATRWEIPVILYCKRSAKPDVSTFSQLSLIHI